MSFNFTVSMSLFPGSFKKAILQIVPSFSGGLIGLTPSDSKEKTFKRFPFALFWYVKGDTFVFWQEWQFSSVPARVHSMANWWKMALAKNFQAGSVIQVDDVARPKSCSVRAYTGPVSASFSVTSP